jgi:hypothetical protein
MPIWMQVAAVVILATIIVVPILRWSEQRARRRYESWSCPECRSAFGAQQQRRFWAVKRDPYVAGLPRGGPIMHCPRCQRDFAFDGDGKQVDEQRNYVQRES